MGLTMLAGARNCENSMLQREKEKIDMKLLSDSNLRHAEQVGLRADVLCMSGAEIGHLANALRDDPKITDHGAAGVVLGGNDIANSESAPGAEFE